MFHLYCDRQQRSTNLPLYQCKALVSAIYKRILNDAWDEAGCKFTASN